MATYLPSGDQIGFEFPVRTAMRSVATPVPRSRTRVVELKSPTRCFPSGEIHTCSPAVPALPRYLPWRSRHTYCWPVRGPETYANTAWREAAASQEGLRSEERRVGKECGSRWTPDQ